MYCMKCGAQIPDNSSFCMKCGCDLSFIRESENSKVDRKIEYSGEIKKCPSCGDVLNSFVSKCPTCGYELRGVDSSKTLKQFALEIQNTNEESKQVTLIRNYPIPNTKEDIFEFMILASTNMNGETRENVFEAWLVKFEQCYQKAILVFGAETDFTKIQDIYERTTKQISKEKLAQGANKLKNGMSSFLAIFPNIYVGIVAIFLGVYEIGRIAKGYFAPIDIILVVLILRWVYKITTKGEKQKKRK